MNTTTLSADPNVSRARGVILRTLRHGEQTEYHTLHYVLAAGCGGDAYETAVGELLDRGLVRSTLTTDHVPSLARVS